MYCESDEVIFHDAVSINSNENGRTSASSAQNTETTTSVPDSFGDAASAAGALHGIGITRVSGAY